MCPTCNWTWALIVINPSLLTSMSESVRCSVLSNSATPWTVAFQPPVHEFLQARILKWVAFLFSPRDLPDPGIWFWSSALQADCLPSETPGKHQWWAAAAAAKLSQSCPTLCDPINGSPPGSPVPGILQARALEWVAISFSNEWKWEVKVKSLSCVQLFETPWTAPYQAPPSMGFSRQEY